MKEHLKITLLHIKLFFIFSTILVSCMETEYYKNKIVIKSFTLKKMDGFLEVKFDVDYFSDSTYSNYYAETIEKGLDGIDGKVVFFGDLQNKFFYNEYCQYLKFEDVAIKINNQENPLQGRDLGRLNHKICIPLNLNSIDSNLVLIIENNNSYDTIYNTPYVPHN